MEILLIILGVYICSILYIAIGTLIYKYIVFKEVEKFENKVLDGASLFIILIWPIFILSLPLFWVVDKILDL